jgi:uncharacterized protein YprB with RNaseH-like and TPR domain
MTSSVLLDLETYAIDGVEAYVEKPSAPANYKNLETIERYEAEAFKKVILKAALKPDLGRIVALSTQQDDRDSEPRVWTFKSEAEERRGLEMFWDDFTDGNKRLITFCGHRMDLPFLMRRSLALGVRYQHLRVDRHSPHLDLYRVLTHDDTIDGYRQSFYIKRYGLDVDGCIDDEVTGADIADLVKADNWDAVANHCRCDVMRLYLIADWLGAINAREADTDKPF